MPKKKVGRPTKYKVKFCKDIINFFDIEPYEDIELPHYKNGEVVWKDIKRMPNKLPTIRNFAKEIEVDYTNIYQWIKKHKEFRHAFTQAKGIRKWFLIENGLQGMYNPAFAMFVAKNITNMRDVKGVEVSGKDGESIKIGLDDKTLKLVDDFIKHRKKKI